MSDSKVVKEIGAVFHFKIKNDKSYVVDLKTGEGCVATGEPKVEADVTVETDPANLLKLFNREIEPMNALTTGAVTLKVSISYCWFLVTNCLLSRVISQRLLHWRRF